MLGQRPPPPPGEQNDFEVWDKVIFSVESVKVSVHGGGGGAGPGVCVCEDPPPPRRLLLRTVRILLECILVSSYFCDDDLR